MKEGGRWQLVQYRRGARGPRNRVSIKASFHPGKTFLELGDLLAEFFGFTAHPRSMYRLRRERKKGARLGSLNL